MTITVEVYSCLNPLYYNLPLQKRNKETGELEITTKYGIFKDLKDELLVSMKDRTLLDFKKPLDTFEAEMETYIQPIEDMTLNAEQNKHNREQLRVKMTSLREELPKLLYGDGDIMTRLENEQMKTSFNKISLNFTNLSKKSNGSNSQKRESEELTVFLGVIDDINRLYFEGNSVMGQFYDKLLIGDKKTSFKLRVYSQNKEYSDEFIKQIIDKDIEELNDYIKNRNSPDSATKIKRVNLITNMDKKLDYNIFNLEKLPERKERRRLVQLVDYCNSRLIEMMSKNFELKSRQGILVENMTYIRIPSLIQPKFLIKDIGISDFIADIYTLLHGTQKNTQMKNHKHIEDILKLLKRKMLDCLSEFKLYVSQIEKKILALEDTSLGDKKKDYGFYDLELIFGINGSNLINVTKEVHDVRFRFDVRNMCELSLPAIGMELVGQIAQINPNNTVDINIVRFQRKDKKIIAVFRVGLEYGKERNQFEIKNVELKEKKYAELLKIDIKENSPIQKYSQSTSKLIGRKGIIKRKLRTPKHNFELLTSNLKATNIYSNIKIIPDISITEEDLISFFKMDRASFKSDIEFNLELSDKLYSALTNDKESYNLYLFVSTNKPSQVYQDTRKYSQSFIETKMKENIRFILNHILTYSRVFRPVVFKGYDTKNDDKPFKGSYKILMFEYENNDVLIIDNAHPLKELPLRDGMMEGTIIRTERQGKPVLVQGKDITTLAKLNENVKDTTIIGFIQQKERFKVLPYTPKHGRAIRIPLKLYITQNMPSYNDFKCEVQRYEIRNAFNKLAKSLHLTIEKDTERFPELY